MRCRHTGLYLHDRLGCDAAIYLAPDDPSDEPVAIRVSLWCTKCGALYAVEQRSWIKPKR